MHIYLNRFANTHIDISTSTHLSNSVEEMMRGSAREKNMFGEGQMDRETDGVNR